MGFYRPFLAQTAFSIQSKPLVILFASVTWKSGNESIALFGDKEAGGVVLLKTYDEYYNGYKHGDKDVSGYSGLVGELQEKFPVGEQIIGEQEPKGFYQIIRCYFKS